MNSGTPKLQKPIVGLVAIRKYFQNNVIEPGLRDGTILRLLPRHKVYLLVAAGDGFRFAKNFRETWRRIPLWGRRRILRHWRAEHPGEPVIKPCIRLCEGWERRPLSKGLAGLKATVLQEGCELCFWSQIVEAYPDPLVQDLIAHELAHVVQLTMGFSWVGEDPFEVEEHADGLIEQWGFDVHAMDEWDEKNCVTPDFSKLSKAKRKRIEREAWENFLKYGR